MHITGPTIKIYLATNKILHKTHLWIVTKIRPRPPRATPTKERRECVELRQQLLGRLPQPRDQTSTVEFVILNQLLDGGEPVLV